MLDVPSISINLTQAVILNFTIIATLVLLYNFVPDSILSRSSLAHSLCVGIIFGLAAVASIPALWGYGNSATLGFNIILVPIAGIIGGPVSALFVAASLLAGTLLTSGTLMVAEIITLAGGVLLGTLFSYARTQDRFPKSPIIQYLLLGLGVVLVELSGFMFRNFPAPGSPLPAAYDIPVTIYLLPFFIISILATVVLGGIITFIDRRKHAERELIEYKNNLEALVKERTAELRKENALRKAAFDATADGIVVVDREGNIRAYNRKAMSMLDLPPDLQGGKPEAPRVFADIAVSTMADPASFFCTLAGLTDTAAQLITSDLRFKDGTICEIYVQPEMIGDQIMGRVFSIRDITEHRLAEEAITAANNKLILLSDITRHDILNQMAVVTGYLHLFEKDVREPEDARRIGIMKKSLETMRLQLEFTRDYQDIGIHKPVWERVQTAFESAAGPFAGRVSFRSDVGGLEIFADPLIGRMFYNLIDNSLRHGEHVTEIRLCAKTSGSDCTLVFEDNGTGIPDADKEKIFDKGFGKHTGLGMFLIREILSITGMTIMENGVYGQGARFEIRIPTGKFRSAP